MKTISVNIPTEDGEISGFSTSGVNFYCDKKSHAKIMEWMHAYNNVEYFRKAHLASEQELSDLKKKLRELGGAL